MEGAETTTKTAWATYSGWRSPLVKMTADRLALNAHAAKMISRYRAVRLIRSASDLTKGSVRLDDLDHHARDVVPRARVQGQLAEALGARLHVGLRGDELGDLL